MNSRAPLPGSCHLCQRRVSGRRVRQHLLGCIQARTGSKPASNPRTRSRGPIAQRTAHISVRAPGRPHWLELGVRCDATLKELDTFLRGIWLECCGHLSHFRVRNEVYSVMVPLPGENRRFEPEFEHEEDWQHMGRTISAVVPPLVSFWHEYDYGTPTELRLEHVASFRELVQRVSPSQPWHGGKIVVLARNHSQWDCLRCGQPAEWKLPIEYGEDEEYDDELYEEEGVLGADDLDPVTFCGECAPPEGDVIPLANSPREGVNCFDNTHSWRTWLLGE